MNRSRMTIGRMMVFGAAWTGLAVTRLAFPQQDATSGAGARQPTSDDAKPQTGTPPPVGEAKTASSERTDDSSKLGPWVREMIAPVYRLRQKMDEKIVLNSAQRAKIAQLFDDFLEDTKNNDPSRRNNPNKPANKIFPPDLRELEEKLKQSQRTGDDAEAAKLRSQIAMIGLERPHMDRDHSPILIERIAAELNPAQAQVFQKIVEQWRAVDRPRPPIPRPGPLQLLRRALLDPEVGLSEKDRAMVNDNLGETLKSVQTDKEYVPDKMAKAVQKAQVVIFEKLTPDQRRKAETKLEMLKAEEKKWAESNYLDPNRDGKPEKPDEGPESTDNDPE